MPKRINRCIELLEDGQPIYYAGTRDLTYENGKAMAKTWADYITVDMEHGALDMPGLSQFMKGLVDGGPTNSGHGTPTVIMSVPTDGTDEQVIRAMPGCSSRASHGGFTASSCVTLRLPGQ